MNECQVRRGFFVLRDCGEPASLPCLACSRMVCQSHYKAAERRCVECSAKNEDVSWRDEGYAMGRRTRYYRSSRYTPIYWGAYHRHPYYDDYHVRDFHGAGAAREDFDGDEAGDFHDS